MRPRRTNRRAQAVEEKIFEEWQQPIMRFMLIAVVIPFLMVFGMAIVGLLLDTLLHWSPGVSFQVIFTGIGGFGVLIYYFRIVVDKAVKAAKKRQI